VDGALSVAGNNPVLQQFLDIHPANGSVFEEVNTEKDATSDVDRLSSELDAQIAARDLSIELLEAVARVLLGSKIEKMSTAELKRDILVYSRNHPRQFLEMLNDPMLQLQNTCAKFFEYDLLRLKNKGRDIYFSCGDPSSMWMSNDAEAWTKVRALRDNPDSTSYTWLYNFVDGIDGRIYGYVTGILREDTNAPFVHGTIMLDVVGD
jgi:hypothetical protein